MTNKVQESQEPKTKPSATGEMEQLTREFDWSKTAVGALSNWPQSLTTLVKIILTSRYPMLLAWGKELIFFYNDAYAHMSLGSKHPKALGRPFREVWSEIWPEIGPRIESVFQTGQATWDEGLLLYLERNGFPEETYHTFSYSPVLDDQGQVGGFLCAVTEDTHRTIGERRLRTLRELSAQTNSMVKSVSAACQTAAKILASNPYDVPFALFYLLDKEGERANLVAHTGIEANSASCPAQVRLNGNEHPWPFSSLIKTATSTIIHQLPQQIGALPGGPWPEPAPAAMILALNKPGQKQLAGFLVVGVSARRPLDETYKGFFELLASQVSTSITNALAYEEANQRAEALAELDRAKTTFFANISHEFRTPLTLMLGPLEELLLHSAKNNNPDSHNLLQITQRNGLRLQRLVNTLLDFSRIEAGRAQAFFEPTDISAFTTDLASNFRSACDKAGLSLEIHCHPISQTVYLDRQMWEKIVLNLLSNAFKFTFKGGISIRLEQQGAMVVLQISDTGIGIAAVEMPRLFERFHRIEHAKSRTHEGSGIGLALINELIKLHGGSIKAESRLDEGSRFMVSLPLGSSHLPPEQVSEQAGIASITSAAQALIDDVFYWLPDAPMPTKQTPRQLSPEKRILIVDDNADMRQYLSRILAGQYLVQTASDGQIALDLVGANPPDLILSDAMMPKLDGFALLKTLRANPDTASIPFIILSARAGEESKIEGLQSGADDYLVKPFSAQLLHASISAHLKMARLRQENNDAIYENEKRFRTLIDATSEVVYRMNADWSELWYLRGREFIADTHELNKNWIDKYIHQDERQQVRQQLQKALQAKSVFEFEHRIIRVDGSLGWTHSRAVPISDRNGEIIEWVGTASDISSRKEAEKALHDAARHKDEFLATLAHELRNPLAPLRNGLHIMKLAKDPHSIEKAQAIMERQINQMVRLIDDLLDISRISLGKIELQKETLTMSQIIQQTLETSKPSIDAAGHQLQIDLAPRAIYLHADLTRLAQVFSNLINNAVKYTEKGGLIQLSIRQDKDQVYVSIKDNGVGIPQHMQPYIFEKFTQVDQQLKRSQGGLGIGLSLVKQLVEMHDGLVEVRSGGAYQGSEFIVRLPCLLTATPNPAKPETRLPQASGHRILIVDDNQDAASTLALMLKLMGNTTQIAYDGIEALSIAPHFAPDLIFMDLGMQHLNGYDTARAIRQQTWGEKTLLIALTGWGQEVDRQRSQIAGFDLHLTKPVQPEVLQQLLASTSLKKEEIIAE